MVSVSGTVSVEVSPSFLGRTVRAETSVMTVEHAFCVGVPVGCHMLPLAALYLAGWDEWSQAYRICCPLLGAFLHRPETCILLSRS